jgi:hypothetical protein
VGSKASRIDILSPGTNGKTIMAPAELCVN